MCYIIDMSTKQIPYEPKARQEWIKYRLRLAGYSLASLGREVGVVRTAPALVFYRPYPRMEKFIAEKLGFNPADIWPERYDDRGRPNRPRKRCLTKQICNGDITTPETRCNSKKQKPEGMS